MAKRLREGVDYLERVLDQRMKEGEEVPYDGKNLFGLWLNFCVNSPLPQHGIHNVVCDPHVDGKNGAMLVCVVFVYASDECKSISS